jgi:uncharacterized protein (TIGR02588 family)
MADWAKRTPVLEWIAAAIGLALLLFVFGVIAREALIGSPDQAPAIEVTVRRVMPAGAGFVVEFEAVNRSGATAAAVAIEGVLGEGPGAETSSATLDYVAGEARAQGGLFFRRDPRGERLVVRALGYQAP